MALARALVMEPKVLLFDEPLSNLDAKLRERMRFELVEIQGKLGIPAVYVTHDQAEAMVMSSRVIVMEDGHIAQEGPPEHIYANPKSRFVADFIGLSNFVRAQVQDRGGNGTWLVQSALGRHWCTGEGSHRPGDDVLLAIRPERIRSRPGAVRRRRRLCRRAPVALLPGALFRVLPGAWARRSCARSRARRSRLRSASGCMPGSSPSTARSSPAAWTRPGRAR